MLTTDWLVRQVRSEAAVTAKAAAETAKEALELDCAELRAAQQGLNARQVHPH